MRDQQLGGTARRALTLAAIPFATLLSGCQSAVLNPAGDIALQQRDIILISTALMLIIIVPVMALTVLFAWRYRKGNKDATYDPNFDHSTALELVIWSAPLLIIIALGALTWWSTHLLDPFRPVNRIAANKAVDPKVKPIRVQVVSLDWKWLFIYPEQGIATVNELALPVNVPVRFDLTSTNMMNTFYAPTLAGMIYAMPGMQSQLHAVLNRPGEYEGMSANYSGAGFSDMRFKLRGLGQAGFDQWVAQNKAAGRTLDTRTFVALEKPSEKVPVMRFAGVDADLFRRVVERCVEPGKPCMSDVMRHDQAQGGGEPNDVRAGAGMPSGHESMPPHGQKPEGAIFKDGEEKGSGPNITKPRGPGAPGSTQPASQKNRDMSYLIIPPVPGVAGTGAA
ncbi:cytochrome bo3 quinol oxidase subunit 2 [Sphingomonas gellani]|uniref:Ubiquinol oxidase polypeptide II n=1 Tax=Sphingomonas gellani TaxID=1166340 RepID=A0A1H8AKG6_9SPHN|nr:ubiquinol oxidase subunit II [Sphingomonas gellani]SEM70484.1 cytochrome bo3 quinol oxidase subunit 2 [Sphingomonas gellani]